MDDTSPSYIENRTCKMCGRFDILCQCPRPQTCKRQHGGMMDPYENKSLLVSALVDKGCMVTRIPTTK
jgi:hypothetical protein